MSQTAEKIAKKPGGVLKDSEFVWEDPLDLESQLTDEERMIRDSVRGFAQDVLMVNSASPVRTVTDLPLAPWKRTADSSVSSGCFTCAIS